MIGIVIALSLYVSPAPSNAHWVDRRMILAQFSGGGIVIMNDVASGPNTQFFFPSGTNLALAAVSL